MGIVYKAQTYSLQVKMSKAIGLSCVMLFT